MPMSNHKTILLIEDEVIIAMTEAMTLEKYGFRVVLAHSGQKALEIVEKNADIDLILMDIDLGGAIDGTEVARSILENRMIPLVFLSSHTEQAVVEKTEGITSYGYIVKNSGETVLIASIKMAFRLFEAQQNIISQNARIEAANRQLQVTNQQLLRSRDQLRQGETALHESQERLRLFSEQAQDMIYRFEFVPVRRFSYVSPSATRITGYTPEELYQDPEIGYRMIHPDDSHLLPDLLKDRRSRKDPLVLRWKKKDGSLIWAEHMSSPVYDETGTLVAFEGMARDVTGRQRARNAYEELSAVLDRIIEGSSAGCFFMRCDPPFTWKATEDREILIDRAFATQKIVRVNQAFAGQYGQNPDELLGRGPAQLFETNPEKGKSLWKQLLERGKLHIRTEELRSDGSRFSTLGDYLCLYDSQGRIDQIFGLRYDVTTPETRDEFLQSRTDHLCDALLETDLQGRCRYVSPSHERLLGRGKEILGDSCFEFVHPQDRERAMETFQEAARTGREGRAVYRYLHPERGYIWLDSVGQVYTNPEGESVGLIAIREASHPFTPSP